MFILQASNAQKTTVRRRTRSLSKKTTAARVQKGTAAHPPKAEPARPHLWFRCLRRLCSALRQRAAHLRKKRCEKSHAKKKEKRENKARCSNRSAKKIVPTYFAATQAPTPTLTPAPTPIPSHRMESMKRAACRVELTSRSTAATSTGKTFLAKEATPATTAVAADAGPGSDRKERAGALHT